MAETRSGFAPAKLNLTLRITGRYADERHALDSLVAFVALGDTLAYAPQGAWQLSCSGMAMPNLAVGDNLVSRAAYMLADALDMAPQGQMALHKNILPQAGLGGGSSDAAAALKMLLPLWGRQRDTRAHDLRAIAARLGADVAACLHAPSALRMSGYGQRSAAMAVPPLPLLLVMPVGGLASAEVYAAYRRAHPDLARPPARLPPWPQDLHLPHRLAAWIGAQGNMLTPIACRLHTQLSDVLAALRHTSAMACGMSGSGPACFGLYADVAQAQGAQRYMQAQFGKRLAWNGVTSLLA